ncbi:MAG: ATP-binding protein, partial [Arcobacteraceae bacterium]
MFKFILKVIKNPIIGPIIVSSVFLSLLTIFYLPHLFIKNEKNKIIKESSTIVDHLKTFRAYYDDFVVSKVQTKTNMEINYDHEISLNTIPLPATTIYNLSQRLPQSEGVFINFFSDYPFPNRAKRVLEPIQKQSIDYFRKTKEEVFVNEDVQNGKKVLRVAFPDIMVAQSCVACHNNRIDTPKNDWKLGDVRGVIEVIVPLQNQFVLTAFQTKGIIAFMLLVLIAFIIHYGILYLFKEKEAKEQTQKLTNEVEKQTKDLQESNLLLTEYKKAVDASAIVSKANTQGIITYVNDAFCEVSGYTKEELLGKPHNIVRHKDMPKELFTQLWKTIQSKQIFKGIVKNRTKDNETYYVASTIVPILNKEGEIIEYLSLRYNITELVQTREKAIKAQEAKGIFLANMSHEIRTPLNAIIGFSEILSEANLAIKEKEHAKIIVKSAKSLLDIINDVLDISKMESGKFELENTNFSLFDLTEYIVELFSMSSIEKNVKFFYRVDPCLPSMVYSDSTRLQQVLSNLLSNAIKFTPKEGKIYFDVKVLGFDEFSKKAKIKFSVKDSGIGMTKEQQSVVFKPFLQADSGISRKFGGTGLGLAICWDIIEAMNSIIKVKSEFGKGSEFSFELELDTIENEQPSFEKTNLKFAICSLEEDEDKLKTSVKNYLDKMGTVIEIDETTQENAEFLFCFKSSSANDRLEAFKLKNPKAKVVFVGEKKLLTQKSLNHIDYHINLPVFGSKIYNIIADNPSLHRNVLKHSHTKESFVANVLIAEDNINNQILIKLLLEKLSISTTIVSNGEEAVEAYKNNHYDLILMDINMPVLDGVSATKEIRKYQKEANHYIVPIIALTANSVAGDREKYLENGMDEYLAKPIVFETLVELLKQFLKIDDSFQTQNNQIVDATKMAEILGIPLSVAKKLLERFKKDIISDLKELYKNITTQQSKAICHKAHYIKNSCLNISLSYAVKWLEYIENNSEKEEENLLDAYN